VGSDGLPEPSSSRYSKNKKHLGIRLFEYDYDIAHFYGGNVDHGSSRISVEIVYRFGER
jgi:hypothetical protein